jgi:hypothetical protein
MSVLVVRRAHAPWRDRARDYRVMVDGKQRAAIGNDATVQIPVTPGQHLVKLAIDWCGSEELTVDVPHGQIVRLECKPNASPLLALLYVTIWRNRYISLNTVNT